MGEVGEAPKYHQDHERALAALTEVLVDIDCVISQAQKARKRLWDMPAEYDIQFALDEAIDQLLRVKIRLHDDLLIDDRRLFSAAP